ncbi:uncharacterized protein LOC123298879 [Chrysoperla carnea]|uniref:uncharacterized protein LOC123298879 n=1 Tax=Chrysoperla carnea TaxID=189513 RepID=UPI001D064575|nr:uncharacterized protein LOC123298879 [Chrysoperla carnea]
MAQGKLKVKTKVPMKAKNKQKNTSIKPRNNRPVAPKKQKLQEAHKLKKIVTKTVNKAVEQEIRALASSEGKQKLSKVQAKVAELNKKA